MESTNSHAGSGPKRVIVVGAGWAGLVAAKTYLQVDPSINLTIIDSERTVGGVWCAARCYPGFLADSPVGTFDFSDLPMRDVIGLKDWVDLPGEKVYEYLKAYAKKFHLTERLRLGTTVSKIKRNGDGKRWDVEIEQLGETITCDKLLVATGHFSKPNWPDIPRDDFAGLVLHSKDIGIQHANLVSEKVKNIVVYGGCKSALETVNMCILAGKKVDWIIRETGSGPALMLEVRKYGVHVGRFATGRWKNVVIPSIFATSGFWYKFLHSGRSKLGSWVLKSFWAKAATLPLTLPPYTTKSANIEKLKPQTMGLFSEAGVAALHGNKELLKEIHDGNLLQIHRATITSMSGSKVSLSNGDVLDSDAVIFATGWDYRSTLFSPADSLELGTTAPVEDQNKETESYWENLRIEADKEVVQALPILKDAPPVNEKDVGHTPYRLYRHILPSSLAANDDHSLIFLGLLTSIATSIYAEVAALWGVAWMEGLLPVPQSKAEMDYEIAKVNAWCERRYLTRGRQQQIASGEIQEVTDLLMKDMGLRVFRKSNWLAESVLPASPQDYRGIVREMLDKSRSEKVV